MQIAHVRLAILRVARVTVLIASSERGHGAEAQSA